MEYIFHTIIHIFENFSENKITTRKYVKRDITESDLKSNSKDQFIRLYGDFIIENVDSNHLGTINLPMHNKIVGLPFKSGIQPSNCLEIQIWHYGLV